MCEHLEERKDGVTELTISARVHLGWWNESIVRPREGIGPAVYGERPD
jgi:hypothetical protein